MNQGQRGLSFPFSNEVKTVSVSYIPQSPPTPSAVKNQKDFLKAAELAHFADSGVDGLIANRSRFYDDLLCDLWRHFGLAEQADLALIAVGGYGRQEMFPLSDLDFLILSEQPLSEATEQQIAAFIQFLWDCHFEVGHSVRTLAQCLEEGRADISVATNLLESRFLSGNAELAACLDTAVSQSDFWSIADFFAAKLQEKNERYQRYHNTGYNLEPDIKYSPGGLRDLHLLSWIALRHGKVHSLDELLQTGFVYPEEYRQLKAAQQVLFRTRFALHLILKRYDNRLLFDRQLKVSELLGFQGSGNEAVEAMMRGFFQALQTILLLSNILLKHYQEQVLNAGQPHQIMPLDANFELFDQGIHLRNPHSFLSQPETIFDLFRYLTEYPEADIHSDTQRQLILALAQLETPLCRLPQARAKFLQLFNAPQAIARAVFPMHQYGVLTAYLPDWKPIVGLMQFDLFHVYTVDEHTLRVLLKLESFLDSRNAEQHPLCTRLFPTLPDRRLMYFAALFHDIAKGRGGDHAKLGVADVQAFAEQHGLSRQDSELMAWLVENHLLMSVVAQRRDIHDPEVVLAFAHEVKNQSRLDYLTCLTVADICATNSNLWNDWKRSLLATLYQYCSRQLQQGMEHSVDYQDNIEEHRRQAKERLSHLARGAADALWARFPDEYFLRNSPKQIAWHTELLCTQLCDPLVKVSNKYAKGGTEVFIYYADQPYLFNKVVNIMGAKNVSIYDAQIITTEDGYVLDSFIVSELEGKPLRNDRRRALETALSEALSRESAPPKVRKANHKLQHFSVPTTVRFFNTEKPDQTEMELFALDKPGLLATVSEVFSRLQLNLLNAKITTIGERAEDFFILSHRDNRALTATERESLVSQLQQAVNDYESSP